jgi:hypothetical protein
VAQDVLLLLADEAPSLIERQAVGGCQPSSGRAIPCSQGQRAGPCCQRCHASARKSARPAERPVGRSCFCVF